VYGIMKRHRGRAEIQSVPGQGTTVRLVFPLATALTPSGEMHAFLDRVPKRVLVVEPDRATRDFVQAVLVADGHVVDAAPSVADAVARVAGAVARHGSYDLLLVAPELPDGRCTAVVECVREQWRGEVRVGLLAPRGADQRGERAQGGYDSVADFTVATPVRPEELLALAAAEG
jgi:DNA-binding response OmpR family regulator